jgi:calcineurin-like phosphoesterase family protein
MKYFLADPHMGHNNLLSYQSEPFETIEQKEALITANIKKTVGSGDELWLLGDVFLHGWHKERAKEWLSQFKFKKILIMGNHDKCRSVTWFKDIGFNEVYQYPVILEDKYIISHEPIEINMIGRFKNIHGHLHTKDMNCRNYLNVCVEKQNYTPISFDKAKKVLTVTAESLRDELKLLCSLED